MNQYQITSRPRHLRNIFFINDDHEQFLDLIHINQKMWGGRYNPIIPVKKNKISDGFVELLKYYDPDYIYYDSSIDVDLIKNLRIFNPSEYKQIESQGYNDVLGVNALYLLSQIDMDAKILIPKNLWEHTSPLLDFYKINFGLDKHRIWGDSQITKKNPKIEISEDNFSSLNQILIEENPINTIKLSKRNLNTAILRNLDKAQHNSLEIVVAKKKSSIDDLTYFWNRHLFQCSNILFCTLEEMNILAKDEYFLRLLSNMTFENPIEIVSLSINEDKINKLIEGELDLRTEREKMFRHCDFRYKSVENFPFDILDADGLFNREFGEDLTTQTLMSENGLYHIPNLSFTKSVGFYPQKWAIDVDIKKTKENQLSKIQVPFTTDSRLFFKGLEGRINKKNSFSLIIHNQKNESDSTEINIPSFFHLSSQLICRPIIQADRNKTKFTDIAYHDDSYRMMSFIKLFNSNLTAIEDYFEDKFWVDNFEKLCTSNEDAGDTIIFDGLVDNCIEVLKRNGTELGDKDETYKNRENLEIGLQQTLKWLNKHQIFLKGYNLKCPNCSSKIWYHIEQVGEIVKCKGCLEEFHVPVETDFAYKLNDLIKNNIYQTKSQRDGNLTVIRTLVYLKKLSRLSFFYGPQINLYENIHSNKPFGDIDIFCFADGNLIIGEAKHNSEAFFVDNGKCLESLVTISKEIFPDKIILSCYQNNYEKLEKAKKSLVIYFNKWPHQPEIEIIDLSEPDYFDLEGYKYFYY